MKISVVTPSFNQGQFIERTLQSVALQREALPAHIVLEHVVFDGGSTDKTVDVLKDFHPAVKWVSKQDEGQADAVNQGLLATDGEIIGWLNSDDIYYPGAMAKVIAFFEANPTIDVVYGMADHIDIHDQAFEAYPTEPWDFERLKDTCIICQPALFFRRKLIKQVGLLDASLNYCMDYEYWLRLGKAGVRFAYLQEKLAGSRLYADNKTLSARINVHGEINDMFKRTMGTVPDRWLFNYAHAVMDSKIKRDEHPSRYTLGLIISSAIASWRWNRQCYPILKYSLVHWGRCLFSART